MGEMLYELYREVKPPHRVGAGTRIYAPVGSHEDLLAYLVRRLLENGANTSFVNRLADEKAPVEAIVADPVEELMALHALSQSAHRKARTPCCPIARIPMVSSGPIREVAGPVIKAMEDSLKRRRRPRPIVGGVARKGDAHAVTIRPTAAASSARWSRRRPTMRWMRSAGPTPRSRPGTRWAATARAKFSNAPPTCSSRTAII